MKLTDTHCHLDFSDFDNDRAVVLNRASKSGVERILIPGIDLPSSHAAIELGETNQSIFAAVGIHPNSANKWDMDTIGYLDELTSHAKVVAIGEIGLDYYRDWAPRGLQKRIFYEQLNLAQNVSFPVIIHTRNASPADRSCISETLEILSNIQVRGVLHSFSGNLTEAEQALELGFYLGITGPVTYKNAAELRKVVEGVPLDRLLIETDSPFLTPTPYHGKRNEPSYVGCIAEKIGEIHKLSPEYVAEITTANARRLFQWRD